MFFACHVCARYYYDLERHFECSGKPSATAMMKLDLHCGSCGPMQHFLKGPSKPWDLFLNKTGIVMRGVNCSNMCQNYPTLSMLYALYLKIRNCVVQSIVFYEQFCWIVFKRAQTSTSLYNGQPPQA